MPNPAGPDGRPGAAHAVGARPDEEMSAPARRLVQAADAMPDWLGSVRFRLTALYSLVLFGLAAFAVAGVYALLASRLQEERVYVSHEVDIVQQTPGGITFTPTDVRAEYRSVEALANERALGLLRSYSLGALALLFLASLVVGWLVAGRVLAPIGRITAVARDIQATDLSRRISLRGPPDELKQLADTFDAMLARLDDAFEGQRRFIQEASHELRNPLAVMRTSVEVALADEDPAPEDLRHTVEVVGRTAARLSRLVDDLIVYARQGTPAEERTEVDLADVVQEVADEFAAAADARGLRIATEPGTGAAVSGDRLALRRAAVNLVANAVRLAPGGSVVRVASGQHDRWAWLAVEDEGPGIAAQDRAHVFERFWRGDRSAAREEGRSGLGLAIVDQIARDHGGAVEVEANPAGGSTFTVWLPVAAHATPSG